MVQNGGSKKVNGTRSCKIHTILLSVSTIPTILGRAKQPMRIQLDECNNIGQTSEVRKYCVCFNWATTMTQRSEKCFIRGVCLSLKRGLSCFIAHTPSAVIFVLVGVETKQAGYIVYYELCCFKGMRNGGS